MGRLMMPCVVSTILDVSAKFELNVNISWSHSVNSLPILYNPIINAKNSVFSILVKTATQLFCQLYIHNKCTTQPQSSFRYKDKGDRRHVNKLTYFLTEKKNQKPQIQWCGNFSVRTKSLYGRNGVERNLAIWEWETHPARKAAAACLLKRSGQALESVSYNCAPV